MAQRRQQVDLGLHALLLRGVDRGLHERLDGDLTAQHLVGAAMHERHAAVAERLPDSVPPREQAARLQRVDPVHVDLLLVVPSLSAVPQRIRAR